MQVTVTKDMSQYLRFVFYARFLGTALFYLARIMICCGFGHRNVLSKTDDKSERAVADAVASRRDTFYTEAFD